MTDFTGKTALVIGGSRGIGAAIVRRFAADGATVTFTYAGSKDAADALARDTGARATRSDAANRDALAASVREAGPLDVLVVNAGIAMFTKVGEVDHDEVDRMIDINVRAPFHASMVAAETMREGGRIILIGSTNGSRAPFAGLSGYSMTKSALQGLARGLSRDLGERRITINVIEPGPIGTDMNPADGPFVDLVTPFLSIRRYGRTDEVAALAAYLASPEADYVTGALHTIDGGFGA